MENLASMTVEKLLELQLQIQNQLGQRKAKLEQELSALGVAIGAKSNGRQSTLKGSKVPPKYKGPKGELWAGRGAKPRWLTNAMKGNKKLTLASFLIK